jgi:hypothetical protein
VMPVLFRRQSNNLSLMAPESTRATCHLASGYRGAARGKIHGAGVARIELVPRVAGMIHHDLPCHRISRSGYSLWMEPCLSG